MSNAKNKNVLIDEDDGDDDDLVRMKNAYRDKEEDDDDDDEEMDEFEIDGFIVDNEDEEENGKEEPKKKKRNKRKPLKDLVLDHDDLELLEENKNSVLGKSSKAGNEMFKQLKKVKSSRSTANTGNPHNDISLCDEYEDEESMSDDGDDEIENFIVYGEEEYEKGHRMRQQILNQKNSKQVTVAASSTLEKGSCSVVDINTILKHKVVKIAKPDEFSEFELDEYITERDDHRIQNDVPERMQMFEEIAGPAPIEEISIEQESSWIFNQLAGNMYMLFGKKSQEESEGIDLSKNISKDDIMRFLKLRHLEKFDVPFIAMYRKEMCLSLLGDHKEDDIEDQFDNEVGRKPRLKWHKMLWTINDLDKKWLLLQKRKGALQLYYDKRYEEESFNVDDTERFSVLDQQFDRIMKSLKLAETERDVDDVDSQFCLHFPPPEDGTMKQFKLPRWRSDYSNCCKADLHKLVQKFGCSSEQFGLHLMQGKTGMESQKDPVESPDVAALDFICPMFGTPEEILKGARFMAALEISCEPCVKKHVRGIFLEKAVVSTFPTAKGDKIVDSFHPFYGVKWLLDKPLDKFQEAQWLHIQKAEAEKLLEVSIRLPESVLNNLITDCQNFYLVGSGEASARLWDEQRKLIIQDVFSNFLLPFFEKEIRSLLSTRAKHWLLMEYGKQLWKKISVAPYQQNGDFGSQKEDNAPTVMACCWGPGKPPITFVMLGSSGQLHDVLQIRSLSSRSQDVIDQQRKKNDQQRVLKFIKNHRPGVIVLGAVNTICSLLKEDIEEILQNEEHPTDVVYGDESFAQIYEHSKVALCQLPGQEGIVRRAVALGRYLQNPLAMIATLCGPQKDIVSWKLNSLDHFLTTDDKYEMIETLLVDVTNQVGFDVSAAVDNDWLFAPLQFISGLGPQKSAFLQCGLRCGKTVNSRYDLPDFGLKPKKIFHNAAGFLRVRGCQLLSVTSDFGLLDNTRIHPESYGIAIRFANAVHNDAGEVQPIMYIKNNPNLLNEFDIDEYAANFEREQGENKKETLHDIKSELLHGFFDPRKPYEKLTPDEVFYLISGKNEDAVAEGRIIKVTVRRVLPLRAFCALDSGLTGVITKDDYVDGADDFSLTDKLHEGDVLTCKIKELDKSRYQVLLTCKESELKGCRYQGVREVDTFYCEGKAHLLKQQDDAKKDELASKHIKQRIIIHPRFKNITKDEAVKLLSEVDVGESIFHPSPKGPFFLTLTLKVCDGLYVHKDIIEGEKDQRNITSLLYIGKTLKIGDCTFKDLDEVMDQYVNPMVINLKAMISFQKFKRGSKEEVVELLRAEKSEFPLRIVYCFHISYDHPGTFILSYMRTNLRHEFVGLHPKGFRFRKQIFGRIEQVVAYFQRHIDDLKHVSAPVGRDNADSFQDAQGRKDYGGDGCGRGGHPSGLPRPDGGRGRGHRCGRGHNDGNRSEEFGQGYSSKWGSDSKDEDTSSGGAWGGSGSWDSQKEGWSGSDSNQGHRDGSSHGRGHGRGRGRGYDSNSSGDKNTNNEAFSAGWSGSGNDDANGGNWSSGGGWTEKNEGNNASGGSWSEGWNRGSKWGSDDDNSWDMNTEGTGEDGGKSSKFSGGGRSWGGSGGGWASKVSNEWKGILGSAPASGNDWAASGKSSWGNKDMNDSKTGNAGWGGKSSSSDGSNFGSWGNKDTDDSKTGNAGWGNKGTNDSKTGNAGWGGISSSSGNFGGNNSWGNKDSNDSNTGNAGWGGKSSSSGNFGGNNSWGHKDTNDSNTGNAGWGGKSSSSDGGNFGGNGSWGNKDTNAGWGGKSSSSDVSNFGGNSSWGNKDTNDSKTGNAGWGGKSSSGGGNFGGNNSWGKKDNDDSGNAGWVGKNSSSGGGSGWS